MRFLKKRGRHYAIDNELGEAYNEEEKYYIKSVMGDNSRDALVREYIVVWLLTHHPDIFGFGKSLRETIHSLNDEDRIGIPDHVVEGSVVSKHFVVVGDFDIGSSLQFHLKIKEPLVGDDGSQYYVPDELTVVVRKEEKSSELE